jgi:Tfp pilus assembly protein PilO
MSGAAKRFYGVFGSVILIVAAGVVFFSFVVPKSREIQELRSERHALVEFVNEKNDAVGQVSELLNKYKSISALQETLSASLPTEEDVPGIVNQLQGLANLSGVVIDSLSLQFLSIRAQDNTATIEPVGTLRATVGIKGDYNSIKEYISLLETNIRIIDLNSMQISGGTEGNVLSYEIVVDTYYQR